MLLTEFDVVSASSSILSAFLLERKAQKSKRLDSACNFHAQSSKLFV